MMAGKVAAVPLLYFVSATITSGVASCTSDVYPVANHQHHRSSVSFNRKKKEIVIVKFGGSALTNKDKFESLRDVVLGSVSDQIKKLQTENNLIILIHGAGSFGHFTAKSYSLSNGGYESSWLEGVSITRRSVTRLNGFVLDSLLAAPIPAVSVELFPTTIVSNKSSDELHQPGAIAFATKLLQHGFLPVLHGDVVLNGNNRCSIYSGDKIMKWLCNSFHSKDKSKSDSNEGFNIKAAVFLTDVAGVFSHPPDHPSAMLIRQIVIDCDDSDRNQSMSCYTQYSDQNLAMKSHLSSDGGDRDEVIQISTSQMVHDVTGGIAGKLQTAVDIARLGIPVYIVQAGTEHALKAMQGIKPDICTVISRRLH